MKNGIIMILAIITLTTTTKQIIHKIVTTITIKLTISRIQKIPIL